MTWFILKTEPSEYSYADLVRDKRTAWTGIKNPGARIHLRLARVGDRVLIYHTGDERAIVGLAKVVRAAYADPASPGLTDDGQPKAPVVDLAPVGVAKTPVTLAQIKSDARFKSLTLLRQARLSVSTLDDVSAALLCKLAGL